MKTIGNILHWLSIVAAFSTPVFGAPPQLKYTLAQQDIRDYDTISRDAAKDYKACTKIKSNEFFYDCMASLFDGILGRRDQNDGTRAKLFSMYVYKIDDSLRGVMLQRLTERNTQRVSDTSLSVDQRATAVEILKNLIAELDPSKSEQRAVLEKIRETGVTVAREVVNYRKSRFMLNTPTFTESAKLALSHAAPPVAPAADSSPLADDDTIFGGGEDTDLGAPNH